MVGSWSLGAKFRFRKHSADLAALKQPQPHSIAIIGRFALELPARL
jgi:hypothetical protein